MNRFANAGPKPAKPGVLAVMDEWIDKAATPVAGVRMNEQIREARATVERLADASQKLGELIHTWRETGTPVSLRELAKANEEVAAALAAFRGEGA